MSNMSKFIPNEEYTRTALILCYYLKKTAAESYRLLTVNLLHRKKRVSDSFGVSKVLTSRLLQRTWKTVKKFEDEELQALLDEEDSQTQK